MWWTGEEERATYPFPVTDLQFLLVRWSFGNYVARFASVPNFHARAVDCGKSTTPTTEPGLPGPRLAGLGMGGGKGSE